MNLYKDMSLTIFEYAEKKANEKNIINKLNFIVTTLGSKGVLIAEKNG